MLKIIFSQSGCGDRKKSASPSAALPRETDASTKTGVQKTDSKDCKKTKAGGSKVKENDPMVETIRAYKKANPDRSNLDLSFYFNVNKERIGKIIAGRVNTCVECGGGFYPIDKHRLTCSGVCKAKHNLKSRRLQQKGKPETEIYSDHPKVAEIRSLIQSGEKYQDIAKKLGVGVYAARAVGNDKKIVCVVCDRVKYTLKTDQSTCCKECSDVRKENPALEREANLRWILNRLKTPEIDDRFLYIAEPTGWKMPGRAA